MAILSLSAVMLKLKFANAKGGMFRFIPPKAELRPVKRRRSCDIAYRTNGGASPTLQIL